MLTLILTVLSAVLLITLAVFFISFFSPLGKQNDPYYLALGEQYGPYIPEVRELIRRFDERTYEEVTIKSFDGLTLYGYYYHLKDGAPVALCMHGYRGHRLRDFCGGNRLSLEMECNLFVIDQRAHGKSGGHTISYGINERRDALLWANYLNERFPGIPVFLFGVSMGAATVCMAAGENLPANVKGIIADCPYSVPSDIIAKVAKDFHLPSKFLMPFVKLSAKLFGGFDLLETSAEEEIKKAKVPVLLIHGTDDRFVPDCMSGNIKNNNPEMVRRELFPGAGHTLSYFSDPQRYESLVRNFIEENSSAK